MVTEGVVVLVVAVLVMSASLLSSLVPRSFTRPEDLGRRTRGGSSARRGPSRAIAEGGGPDRRSLPGGVLRASARPSRRRPRSARRETSPPANAATLDASEQRGR